jgi:diguanylate cyclase (GGDEF)-like protein
MQIKRSKFVTPLVVLFLTFAAIASVWLLVGRADSSRAAQLRISSATLSLSDLQTAPYDADPATGGSVKVSRVRIQDDDESISGALMPGAQVGVAPGLLAAGREDFARVKPVVASVYRIATSAGGLSAAGARVLGLDVLMAARSRALSGVLAKIAAADAADATTARTQVKFGAAGTMLLLLAAFGYFYFRSVAAREALRRLADAKGEEARTDALTGLRNRRGLAMDFLDAGAQTPGVPELLLVMFDLDGFKQYNDTFGHAAGDALIQRLGGRLAVVAEQHAGSAYRMGGDEFCVLVRCLPAQAERLIDDATAAIQDTGEAWHIGCSHGIAWIPSEAVGQIEGLALADERMYANKTSRSPTTRQVTDALLQVITEQDGGLDDHVERVAELAGTLATALGQPTREVARIRLAATLHDVGKTAIPASILDKAGDLDDAEWEFIRSHPAIGGRIVAAAPALADTAALIHSSHERIDGHGYPDGLAGTSIPLGSRIIAVCNAFDAMTSGRPYRQAISVDAALDELNLNAGTQFDASIVETFCQQIALRAASASDRIAAEPKI